MSLEHLNDNLSLGEAVLVLGADAPLSLMRRQDLEPDGTVVETRALELTADQYARLALAMTLRRETAA